MIGSCFWGPQDDRAAGRPAPSTGPPRCSRPTPAAQVRPRARNKGKYPAHRTRLSSGKLEGEQGRLAHSEKAPGREVPPAASGHAGVMDLGRVGYAAMRPVAGDTLTVTGPPAGGLWAWAGDNPRWVRIFPVCRARHRQVDDFGLLMNAMRSEGWKGWPGTTG